jgi:hypothetical protein
MPARSEKQRRWAFARKGKAWAKRHHFDRVRRRRKRRSS